METIFTGAVPVFKDGAWAVWDVADIPIGCARGPLYTSASRSACEEAKVYDRLGAIIPHPPSIRCQRGALFAAVKWCALQPGQPRAARTILLAEISKLQHGPNGSGECSPCCLKCAALIELDVLDAQRSAVVAGTPTFLPISEAKPRVDPKVAATRVRAVAQALPPKTKPRVLVDLELEPWE